MTKVKNTSRGKPANGDKNMATKTEANKQKNDKNANKQGQQNGQAKPQAATPAPQQPAAASAPKPAMPEQTDVKGVLAAAKERSLTKKEAGILRSAGLKKDGTSFEKHKGPRTKPDVTLVSVKNAVETFGVEAVAKMADRYGKALKKPLRQYINTLTKDSDDQKAMNALYKHLWPITGRGGFRQRDDFKVGTTGTTPINFKAIAKPGDRISKGEVVTLADGRVGIFIMKVKDGVPEAPKPATQAAPQAPAAESPASAAPAF